MFMQKKGTVLHISANHSLYESEVISLKYSNLDKSAEDKERESLLIDQWVHLTEEKNFLLHPEPGSNVPGSPSNRSVPKHSLVQFQFPQFSISTIFNFHNFQIFSV